MSEAEKARCYVAGMAARLLECAIPNGDGWLYDNADEPTILRREKAVRQLAARLRKIAEAESK